MAIVPMVQSLIYWIVTTYVNSYGPPEYYELGEGGLLIGPGVVSIPLLHLIINV